MTEKEKLKKLLNYISAKEANATGVIRAVKKKKPLDVTMLGAWVIEKMAYKDCRQRLQKIVKAL